MSQIDELQLSWFVIPIARYTPSSPSRHDTFDRKTLHAGTCTLQWLVKVGLVVYYEIITSSILIMSRYLVGDFVELEDGRRGFIRFFGKVHFSSLRLYGIELIKGNGVHNGTFENHTYFSLLCDHSENVNKYKQAPTATSANTNKKLAKSSENGKSYKHSTYSQFNKRRHSIQLTQSFSQEIGFDSRITAYPNNNNNNNNATKLYQYNEMSRNA